MKHAETAETKGEHGNSETRNTLRLPKHPNVQRVWLD